MNILCRLLFPLIAGIGMLLPDAVWAASSAYVQTTEGLNLHHVRLTISAPPEFMSRLSERARSLFANAGLPLPGSDGQNKPSIATLTLSLIPRSLADTCPGYVLYAPSLTLTEPVMITRNSVLMNDVTWLAHTGPQVRKPVTMPDLEQDLDAFLEQFIADYRAANAGVHPLHPDSAPMMSGTDPTPPVAATTEQNETHSNAGLKQLRVDQLRLSVSAGRFSQPLTTRALQQFSEAGRPLKPGPGRTDHVTLGIELTQQTLEDRCPGKVLYESGLYLVEQVQIARNRRVSIWTDTWLKETTQVVTPRSQQQLESDQESLLRQFIDSLNTR